MTTSFDETQLFGVDVWNDGTVQTGRYASGLDLVAHRIYTRLTSPTGSLPEDPTWGWDVRNILNGDFTPAEVASKGQKIRAEVLREPAVRMCTSLIEVVQEGPSTSLNVSLACELHTGEKLRLVMTVSEATVDLLEVVR